MIIGYFIGYFIGWILMELYFKAQRKVAEKRREALKERRKTNGFTNEEKHELIKRHAEKQKACENLTPGQEKAYTMIEDEEE